MADKFEALAQALDLWGIEDYEWHWRRNGEEEIVFPVPNELGVELYACFSTEKGLSSFVAESCDDE